METKSPSDIHIYQNITNNINVASLSHKSKNQRRKGDKANVLSKAIFNGIREHYQGRIDIYS